MVLYMAWESTTVHNHGIADSLCYVIYESGSWEIVWFRPKRLRVIWTKPKSPVRMLGFKVRVCHVPQSHIRCVKRIDVLQSTSLHLTCIHFKTLFFFKTLFRSERNLDKRLQNDLNLHVQISMMFLSRSPVTRMTTIVLHMLLIFLCKVNRLTVARWIKHLG